MPTEPIRVMLVDDQVLLRTGFRMVLAAQPDMEVTAEAGDGIEALEILRSTAVDVVLMDVRMPRLDGVETTRRVCQGGEGGPGSPKVLILTTFDLDEYAFSGLKSGASGFMLKDAPADKLANAIREVSVGRRVVDSELALAAWDTEDCPLAAREIEVLRLTADGHTVDDVAGMLFLSAGTVRNYLTSVVTKLNARNRVDAIRIATDQGWL